MEYMMDGEIQEEMPHAQSVDQRVALRQSEQNSNVRASYQYTDQQMLMSNQSHQMAVYSQQMNGSLMVAAAQPMLHRKYKALILSPNLYLSSANGGPGGRGGRHGKGRREKIKAPSRKMSAVEIIFCCSCYVSCMLMALFLVYQFHTFFNEAYKDVRDKKQAEITAAQAEYDDARCWFDDR